jgi:hypothetical protein
MGKTLRGFMGLAQRRFIGRTKIKLIIEKWTLEF